MSEIELKPCPSPSCGSVAVYIRHVDDLHYVVCSDCVLNGPMSRTSEKEAVALWNELPRAAAYQPESSPVQLPEFVAPAVEYPRRRGRRADWKKQRPIEPPLAEILLEACEVAHVPARELVSEIRLMQGHIQARTETIEALNQIIRDAREAANLPSHERLVPEIKRLRSINDAVYKWMDDYDLCDADELKASLDEKEAILGRRDADLEHFSKALYNIRSILGVERNDDLISGLRGIIQERDEMRSELKKFKAISESLDAIDELSARILKVVAENKARELIR